MPTAKEIAESEIRKANLEGWKFRYHRYLNHVAKCSHRNKTISMNREIANANTNEFNRGTILHEIAHAKTNKNGHGKEFIDKCKEVNCPSWARGKVKMKRFKLPESMEWRKK